MSRRNGFTLIELMIVVAIIGILASIAMPSYRAYTVRARMVESLTLAESVKASIIEYYQQHFFFPGDNAAAGVPAPNLLIGHFVNEMTVEGGAIHVRFRHQALPGDNEDWLSLRPLVVTGSPTSPISWLCGRQSVPEGMEPVGEDRTTVDNIYLPSACR